MGMSVVSVATGGLPVVDVGATTKIGLAVTEAANGMGVAVTKVAGKPGLPVVYETIGVAAPVVPATFNGTPSAGVVMSNGNLTATHGTITPSTGVSSASFQSSGKYYFELIVAGSTTNANQVGIVAQGAPFTNFIGTTNTFVNIGSGSVIYAIGVSTAKDLGTAVVGSVFGYAVDLTAYLIWIRRNSGLWNATAGADPVAAVGGISIAAGLFAPGIRFTNGAATDAFSLNCGQAAFANPAPGSFGKWPA